MPSFIIPVRIDAKGVTKGLNNISSKFKTLGRNLTMGVTLPLAGIATAASRMALGFDESLTKINTLVGISKSELAGMRGEVMKIAGATAQAPEKLADALFTVTSAGLRGKDAMAVLEMAAKSSASGLGETKSVAQALTGIMQSYAKSGMTAERATDVLTATVRAGNLEASELAPVLGRVTGIASQLGISFEEVGASIATFTRLGVNSAEAVTGLSGIMNGLIKPTDQTHEALAAIGMDMDGLRESIKEKGLAATLTDLVAKVGDNQDIMGQLIPNVRALSAVLGTAGAQGEDYIKVAEEIANSTGLANEVFEDTAKSASFKFKQSLNQLTVVGTEIGSMLLPPLIKAATFVGDLVKRFMELDGTTKTIVLGLAGLAAGIGPLITALGFLLSPIGMIIAGIGTIGVVAYKNFDAIIGFVTKVINKFIDLYNNSLLIRVLFESIRFTISTWFDTAKIVVKAIWQMFKKAGELIVGIFTGIGEAIFAILTGDWDKVGDILSDTLTGALDDFVDIGKSYVGAYEEIGKAAANNLAEGYDRVLNNKMQHVTEEGIKGGLKNAVDGIKDKVLNAGSKIAEWMGIGFNTSIATGGGGDDSGGGGGGTDGGDTSGGTLAEPVVTQLNEIDEKASAVAESVSGGFGDMASSIVESFNLANSGIQGFFQKIFETLIKLTQMIVKQGIIRRLTSKKNIVADQAEAMSTSIKNATVSASGTGPAAIFTQPAFIATLVGGVLAAFASIPKFAKGGIVTGPTLGIMGEAGTEAIIPLDRLDSIVGGQKGEFVLRGSDLVLAMDRAQDFKSRITG